MYIHDKHMDDVSVHTYIHIGIYRNFFVEMISVGLTSACPNYARQFAMPTCTLALKIHCMGLIAFLTPES